MSVTRRTLLQGLLVAAGTVSTGTGWAISVPAMALLVYDSRLPQSRTLKHRHGGRSIDLAHEHANFWRHLRTLRYDGRVVGLTSWSDLVQVRGLLEEQGKRLRAEAPCGPLFYWEMA
jgi:hypothetical protein